MKILAVATTCLCLRLPASGNAQTCAEWNLATDFRVAPNAENPNRDTCGNLNTWYFMESSSATFPAHIPSSYTRLPEFITDAFSIAGLEQWQGTVVSNGPKDKLPAVGINHTSSLQTPRAIQWGPGVIRVHPFADKLLVVGWRSPVNGTVNLSGGVTDLDNICGNGISWSVDHFDGASNVILASGAFSNGGLQNFANGIGGASLSAINVKQGDFIYIVVDPVMNEHRCDSTGLTMIIRQTAVLPAISPAMLIVLAVGLLVIGVTFAKR